MKLARRVKVLLEERLIKAQTTIMRKARVDQYINMVYVLTVHCSAGRGEGSKNHKLAKDDYGPDTTDQVSSPHKCELYSVRSTLLSRLVF